MQIRNGFEEFFCLGSNLSYDSIISERPGLKTGMDFREHIIYIFIIWTRVFYWKI